MYMVPHYQHSDRPYKISAILNLAEIHKTNDAADLRLESLKQFLTLDAR